jgi:3-isopropylmalate/(R)-2-methylmalate dehydratase small subunit
LFAELQGAEDYQLSVDLERQVVSTAQGIEMSFEVEEFRKSCLLNGLDDIGLTLKHAADIKAFEQQYYDNMPWLK